jgi:hypothetical protein
MPGAETWSLSWPNPHSEYTYRPPITKSKRAPSLSCWSTKVISKGLSPSIVKPSFFEESSCRMTHPAAEPGDKTPAEASGSNSRTRNGGANRLHPPAGLPDDYPER